MRRARFLVLESLYEADSTEHPVAVVLDRRLAEAAEEDPKVASGRARALCETAVAGIREHQPQLDRYIHEAAPRFPLSAMAVVDRNILRLAIWELLSDNSAPVAAVVNEAVELAHRYGGESSPAFVNGVLRTVSTRIQAAGAAPGDEHPESGPRDPDSQEN